MFEVRGKAWDWVLRMLASELELEFVAQAPLPVGQFTFINPAIDGKPNEYSMLEVFDIINEVLQGATKHTLIRGDKTLTLFYACAPPHLWPALPRVSLRDLPGRGRTEIVEVVVKMNPRDVPMGENGFQIDTAIPLENGRVLLRSNVVALMEMMQRIPMVDAP